MAKKKAAKPKATTLRAAPKKKQSTREAERVLRRGPVRRRTPRAAPLPGMEDARIAALDDAAGTMADIREQMNELRAQEAETLQSALNLMRKHEKTTWRAHGVEFVRVPGEERLRCRTTKEKATAETEDENGSGDLEPMDAIHEATDVDEFATV